MWISRAPPTDLNHRGEEDERDQHGQLGGPARLELQCETKFVFEPQDPVLDRADENFDFPFLGAAVFNGRIGG